MASQARRSTIVVGAGITGMVAAIGLLEQGEPVLLVDRDARERLGGQARESFGGILAVGTPEQQRQGIEDSPALALADWLRFGDLEAGASWPARWAESYVQSCREGVYGWLRGLGLRFLPVPLWPEQAGNSVPRWHVAWGSGAGLVAVIGRRLSALAGAGLEMRFGLRVERLLREDGRVTGVAGVGERDGAPFELRGARVLVAAGGIGGDEAQVRALWPGDLGAPPRELLLGAHRFGDGRLHVAAHEAGASVQGLSRMWNYAAGIAHWAPQWPGHGLSLVPPRSALWLDAGGRRFDPPLLAGRDTSELVSRIARAGGVSWQVMNRRIALRELAVSGSEMNPALRERRVLAFARDLLLGNRWLLATLLRNSRDVVTAPDLPGLAAAMNACARAAGGPPVSVEALSQAVQAWDRACAAGGGDAQYDAVRAARARRSERLRVARPAPLMASGSGPLIAIRERILVRKSLGGIVTDLDGRALDGAGQPVAGLYAAGEAAGFGGGGMNGRRALEGTFLGGCIHSARRAAQAIGREAKGRTA